MVERSEIREKDFDAAQVARMVGHLDWAILCNLAHQVLFRLTAIARRNELPSGAHRRDESERRLLEEAASDAVRIRGD